MLMPAVRVLALTNHNADRRQTWFYRIESLFPQLRQLGIEVEVVGLPPGRERNRDHFEHLRGFDICWLHRQTFWPAELRRLRKVARYLILDIDDPVSMSSSAPFNFALGRYLRFRATARAAAAVLAASDGLVQLAQPHNQNVHFIPLNANPGAYSLQARGRDPADLLRLVWIGGRSTFKYLAQIQPHL